MFLIFLSYINTQQTFVTNELGDPRANIMHSIQPVKKKIEEES